jgi:predicted DNA-binding transcriptional regulator YafY
MCSGVPIEGEAGIGYMLRKGFDLPPIMFDETEIAALTLGARIVQSWADPDLARAAEQVLSKVETILPDRLKGRLDKTRLFSPLSRLPPEVAAAMGQIRMAIDTNHKVRFDYARADGSPSQRVVWPLGLFFWGTVWTLGAWCELRQSFRNFRIDRMIDLQRLDDQFTDVQGRTLHDMMFEERKRCDGQAYPL